jgi:hypothetical protein
MTRVTRPFTVEIKRSRAAARGSAFPSPASPASPVFSDALPGGSMMEEPAPRPVTESFGGAAARLAAEALFSNPRAPVGPAPTPSEGEKPLPGGGRILADLNSKDPLEELIRLRAEDGAQRRVSRQAPLFDGHEEADLPPLTVVPTKRMKAQAKRPAPPVQSPPAQVRAGGKGRGPEAAPPRKPVPTGQASPAPIAREQDGLSRAAAWTTSVPTIAPHGVASSKSMQPRSRRRGDAAALPRGERWKRRLPEICR